jgi:UTP--glucose-1-phosphate uridylyltransferase
LKIVLAPNALKGSLSALEAAHSMATGVRHAAPGAELALAPVADGGDGLVEVLAATHPAQRTRCSVSGPLGNVVEAGFLYSAPQKLAIIEMAAASGLALLDGNHLDPLAASSRGTGELIKAALDLGARTLVLGIGGSATTDGGTGLATALGVVFRDKAGRALPGNGASLNRIASIDLSGLDERMRDVDLQVMCDVDNPLLGARGAARTFGPQKGAREEQVQRLEAGLEHLSKLFLQELGKDVGDLPGAGAAGGLGAGLAALFNAELKPGAELILDLLHFDQTLVGADLVLTAEGRLDSSTGFGKAPTAVAARARSAGVPCLALAGALSPGWEVLKEAGVAAAFSLCPGPLDLREAMTEASKHLTAATEQVVGCFLTGRLAGLSYQPKQKSHPMIRKCLFPAAGYGTRFLPATKAMPKEVLPILDKPLIQYGVEEAMDAGMTNIAIITGRGKRAIEDHFDISYELEHQISGTAKEDRLESIRRILDECTFSYTRQIEMKGLGHAILTGEPLIGNEAFGVVLADDLCVGEQEGVLKQMLNIYEKYRCSILAIQEVDPAEVHKYGVIDGRALEDGIYVVNSMVEKPSAQDAPSNLAIIGRYILTPDIFDILRRTPPGKNGELQITDALQLQAKENMVLAYKFKGQRFDCGSVDGFVAATNYFYERYRDGD